MAVNSTLLDNTVPQTNRETQVLTKSFAFPASGISNGDNVQLYTFPPSRNQRLTDAALTAPATLGAGATLVLQINRAGTRTSITTATTAAAVSQGASYSLPAVPFDIQPGDILEALVGGANITGAGTVVVDLQLNYRS